MPITSSIKYLLDTNILIYAYDRESPFHIRAVDVILASKESANNIVIAQQNIVEFCNVLNITYHIPYTSIVEDTKDIMKDLPVIGPRSTSLSVFLKLLKNYKKTSQYIFDLYLAATMLDNGVTHIITANERDFVGIKGISVYNPWRKD